MKTKIVVTGASGFIGNWVTSFLAKRQDVELLVFSSVKPSNHNKNITYCSLDLREFERVKDVVRAFNPHGLIHMAWSGVFNSNHMCINQYENITMLENLLESLSKTRCQFIVGLGSQAEYGPYDIPIKEDFKAKPKTHYGKAKLEASQLLLNFCKSKKIRAVWFRLFSSFGPGDHPMWLIPYVIQSFLKNESPKLTEGLQRCDYLYVKDVADVIIKACFSKMSGVYNLGSGKSKSIREIVAAIYELIDPSCELRFGEKPNGEYNSKLLQADISKLSYEMNWRPHFEFEDSLKETILFF